MRFCKRPWTTWYIINGEKGEVWPCGCLDKSPIRMLGGLIKDDIEQIRNSENLTKLKESILDGSFKYCDPQRCTLIANNQLPDLSEEEIQEFIKAHEEPEIYWLAYDETCNHACSSCRHEYFKGSKEYHENIDYINNKMLPYYEKAKVIDINGSGEIFVCEELLSMLEKLHPQREDFTLELETNGALFDEKHWKRIAHLSKFNIRVTVTVNSFNDTTYRYLNGYANHVEQVLDNLEFISKLRKNNDINFFTISIVAQEANFRELPEYVERSLNQFNADAVRVRGIQQYCMDEAEFWFKDVFNPAHPCYKEAMDVLKLPIMQDSRVWYWEGDVAEVREKKNHPYTRFADYYNYMWKMIQLDTTNCLEGKLEKYKERKIAIYGAGHLCEYLLSLLKKYNIKVVCVLDSRRDDYVDGVKIRKVDVDTEFDDIDVIINTISYYNNEIMDLLKQVGVKKDVIDLSEIIN